MPRASVLAQQVSAFDAEWLRADGGVQRLDKLLAMAERDTCPDRLRTIAPPDAPVAIWPASRGYNREQGQGAKTMGPNVMDRGDLKLQPFRDSTAAWSSQTRGRR